VSYNSDFRERQAASTKAKAALLERFRAAPGPNDPERRGRDEARVRVIEARQARAAAREAARIEREKALAEESARETERRATEERAAAEAAEKAAHVKAEEEARVAAEQKAARDARYAARKAAKKQRRQGFWSLIGVSRVRAAEIQRVGSPVREGCSGAMAEEVQRRRERSRACDSPREAAHAASRHPGATGDRCFLREFRGLAACTRTAALLEAPLICPRRTVICPRRTVMSESSKSPVTPFDKTEDQVEAMRRTSRELEDAVNRAADEQAARGRPMAPTR
jgi:multidrug efflux pump subunit AcrA (membrane-fusion protein)